MAAHASGPAKRYLSHDLAEWACGLRYEHLSSKAVEAAKLFWYDSMGCGLGGSQQEDAEISCRALSRHGGGSCGDEPRSTGPLKAAVRC